MKEDSDPIIIGVVQDFHTSSLHRRIEPAVIYINLQKPIFAILVRVKPGEVREAVSSLESEWRNLFPEKPFDYSFVDENIARQYRQDMLWQKVVTYAAVVAVVTACLGLFGLASLSAVKRTKEIGVRKVLGASVPSILSLLSREFIILVIVSNLLAWPAAFVAVGEWLSGFVYRAEIELGIFALSAAVALVIAVVSVSYHAYRTAVRNPTDSLRYE
jgi:putative ABC transport system permease protein